MDLLYLHNAVEMLHTLGQPALMARFKAAFQWLEQARAQGRIRAYGLATWDCFRRPPGSSDYLQLKAVVALAEEVGGKDHGFRQAQCPLPPRPLFKGCCAPDAAACCHGMCSVIMQTLVWHSGSHQQSQYLLSTSFPAEKGKALPSMHVPGPLARSISRPSPLQ